MQTETQRARRSDARKHYPSWIKTRPVRMDKEFIEFLKTKGRYGETIGDIVARLVGWKPQK